MTNFSPNGTYGEVERELKTADDWIVEAQARYGRASDGYSSPEVHFAAAQAAALIALALQNAGEQKLS